MNTKKKNKIFKKLFLFSIFFILNGCTGNDFLNQNGSISTQQHNLIFKSFLIMLIVVLPVILMTISFSLIYRSSNKKAHYDPSWNHSKILECIIWIVPIIIIFVLGKISWYSTHDLDPKKSILSYKNIKPIHINVISLDWKWLFIYPQYKIATINEICLPINVPVVFQITSNSNMNSFFIPTLGSQVYAMAGMKTNLNLISNKVGTSKGISANYSGYGFSRMKFSVLSVKNRESFLSWVNKVKSSKQIINDFNSFKKIVILNQNYSVEYFSNVYSKLFEDIVDQFHL